MGARSLGCWMRFPGNHPKVPGKGLGNSFERLHTRLQLRLSGAPPSLPHRKDQYSISCLARLFDGLEEVGAEGGEGVEGTGAVGEGAGVLGGLDRADEFAGIVDVVVEPLEDALDGEGLDPGHAEGGFEVVLVKAFGSHVAYGFFDGDHGLLELEFAADDGEAEGAMHAWERGNRAQEAGIDVGFVGLLGDAEEVHDIALAEGVSSSRRR